MGASSSASKLEFDADSTGDQVVVKWADQAKGRYFLVTGAGAGLGFETSRVLAAAGAKVTVTARTQEAADKVAADIKKQHPDADVIGMAVDLSDLHSVFALADRYLATDRPLHALINNAGVMASPLQRTRQGLEMQFGVNHAGHFALTQRLLPRLRRSGTREQPARVVNLSSMGNWLFGPPEGVLFDDLDAQREYDPWVRYGQSKLCNILMAKQLDRRMAAERAANPQSDANVIGTAVHPGAIMGTSLFRHGGFGMVCTMFADAYKRTGGLGVIMRTKNKSVAQGVATTLYAALNPDIQRGGYYADCQLETAVIHERADDEALAQRLWQVSEEIVAKAAAAAGAGAAVPAAAQ